VEAAAEVAEAWMIPEAFFSLLMFSNRGYDATVEPLPSISGKEARR
jgi:hypothetical protein